jgi:hypothetical protein
MSEQPLKASPRRRRPRITYETVMRLFGTDYGGNDSPPFPQALRYVMRNDGTVRRLTSDEAYGTDYRVFAADNDGFELWIGSAHEWDTCLTRAEVRALTRWLIWDWYIKTAWRRPIYFWALHRHVQRFQARLGRPR